MKHEINVLVYPRDKNPYQEMLHCVFPDNVKVTYLENPTGSHLVGLLVLPVQMLFFRLQGFRIFHLHWLNPFHVFHLDVHLLKVLSKNISYVYVRLFLYFLEIIGMRLVWTMHNEVPHEIITRDDKDIMKRVLRAASVIVLLTKESYEKYRSIPEYMDKLLYVPMGHSIGQYPAASLRIPREKGCVNFLFFGQIREYKGVVRLVEEFRSLKYAHVRLRIVGQTVDKSLDGRIRMAIGGDARILYQNEAVRDNEVEAYFRWADIVLLPFTRLTNSSTAILALSLKKPIIAPRIGSLCDLPEESGLYYDSKQADGLKASLEVALSKRTALTQMGEKGYRYVADELSWEKSAKIISQAYWKILQ